MPYSSEKYAYLFDRPAEGITDERFELIRQRDVFRYRTKTIRAGDSLEVELFPVWKTQTELRKAASHSSRRAQRNLNEKNARKEIARKLEANFDKNDLHAVLTYKTEVDEETVRHDVRNFIRRVRGYRETRGMAPLKYYYEIEDEDGAGRHVRRHVHIIIPKMKKTDVQKLWPQGVVKFKKLEPEDGSFAALARYLTKQKKEGRRGESSRNLTEPEIAYKDNRRLNKTSARKMAQDFSDSPREILEAAFPDFRFVDCVINASDFVAGLYITARMAKRPSGAGQSGRTKGVKDDVY